MESLYFLPFDCISLFIVDSRCYYLAFQVSSCHKSMKNYLRQIRTWNEFILNNSNIANLNCFPCLNSLYCNYFFNNINHMTNQLTYLEIDKNNTNINLDKFTNLLTLKITTDHNEYYSNLKLSKLTYLLLDGYFLQNFNHLINLRKLKLFSIEISNINSLVYLTKLVLGNVYLKKVKFDNLTNLEILIFEKNNDIKLTEINSLTRLKKLILNDNITIQNLNGLKNLTHLRLINDKIIKCISHLTNLRKLIMVNNNIITDIYSLTNLRNLILDTTEIIRINNLINLHDLIYYDEKYINVHVHNLTKLTKLQFYHTTCTNNISQLKNISSFQMIENNIDISHWFDNLIELELIKNSKINDLSLCTRLEMLTLENDYCITDISNLTKLTLLRLIYTQIDDISNLINLKDLILRKDYYISNINMLTELTSLELTDTIISNIDCLTNLKMLNLFKSKIRNISTLIQLNHLELLNDTEIDNINMLTNLQTVDIIHNNKITSLIGLKRLEIVSTYDEYMIYPKHLPYPVNNGW